MTDTMDPAAVLPRLKRVEWEVKQEEKIYLNDVEWLCQQLRTALANTRRVDKVRELLTQSFRCISPVPEGTPIQFLAVYVTRWNRTDEPTHGFIEWDDDSIDAAIAATPGET